MKKFGFVAGTLVAIIAVVAIVFLGRQHQADILREQEASHASLVAKQATSSTATTSTTDHKASSSKTAKQGKRFKYVALGDSLAAGDYTTKEDRAYQYEITRYLKNDLGFKPTLDGYWQAGGTIASIATPNYDSIVAMNPDLITIELGTNEQDPNNADYARSVTFKTNLAGLVAKLQDDLPNTKIILLTTWQTETSAAYDKVIKSVGKKAAVPVVDISKVWENPKNISQQGDTSWTGTGDGYHPNDAGNKAIAKLVEKQLDQLYQ
ncbi:SGNH/GDSL hydrolase family protein [Lacticaseibacillus sp. GG6-2]